MVEESRQRAQLGTIAGASMMKTVSMFDKALSAEGKGQKMLVGNAFSIPSSVSERNCILDYIGVLSNIGAAQTLPTATWWDTIFFKKPSGTSALLPQHIVVQKYGPDVERALANPYVQDQCLSNPLRWSNVVALGAQVIATTHSQSSEPSHDNPIRDEAVAFVRAYEREKTACALSTSQKIQHPAAGTDYFVKCQYARDTLLGVRRA